MGIRRDALHSNKRHSYRGQCPCIFSTLKKTFFNIQCSKLHSYLLYCRLINLIPCSAIKIRKIQITLWTGEGREAGFSLMTWSKGYVSAVLSAAVATDLYFMQIVPYTVCSCSYPSSYPSFSPDPYPVINLTFLPVLFVLLFSDSFLLSFLYHFYIFILSPTTSFRLIHRLFVLIHCSPVSCIFQLVSIPLTPSFFLASAFFFHLNPVTLFFHIFLLFIFR